MRERYRVPERALANRIPSFRELDAEPPMVSTCETPAQNGVYRGPATVRVISAGVSGEDVLERKLRYLKKGERWSRGASVVEVETVSKGGVFFREITHGTGALRRQVISAFIRGSHPEGLVL